MLWDAADRRQKPIVCPTRYDDVTHYNNYYEFGTRKNQPATLAQKLKTSLWTVSIEGEVEKPLKLSMDDIMKVAPIEERIYRHRCGGGMVHRCALGRLLAERTAECHELGPYVEGLRLDEAMHPLALLCALPEEIFRLFAQNRWYFATGL